MNQADTGGRLNALLRSAWLPPLFIVAIYLACILLVNPGGEFPLNDDWAYTRSAFRLAAGEGLRIDEWAAPSLIGQALYGGLLTRYFGRHFLILRLSTLTLSCGIALLLWFTLTQSGTRPRTAWVAVLTWVFNPIQFWLSFTFMTEIPFLFFVALGIFLFLRSSSSGGRWEVLACASAFGYAFLIRQTAILFAGAAFVLMVAVVRGTTVKDRIARATVFALTIGIYVAAYHVWTVSEGGSTPAVERKYELLRHITPAQLNGNFFGVLFYLSFMLIPLCILLVPHLCRLTRQAGLTRSLAVLVIWAAIAAYGLWWFEDHSARSPYLPAKAFHSQMPFLLNVLHDSGLGPVTLDPTYYGPPATPVYPALWGVVTVLTAVSAVILGSIVTLGMPGVWRRETPRVIRNLILFSLFSVVAVTGFEVIFSHREEGGLFDRHVLTAALPTLLLVVGLAGIPGERNARKNGAVWTPVKCSFHPAAGFAAVLATVATLAWFSISATHDYLAWNRLRWQLGNDLLAQGADPLKVSGGFEFNAWHNYDTFRARGNIRKIFYWWYDDLEYLITMEPQERYAVRRKLDYYSWLHRRNLPVYLLQRIH